MSPSTTARVHMLASLLMLGLFVAGAGAVTSDNEVRTFTTCGTLKGCVLHNLITGEEMFLPHDSSSFSYEHGSSLFSEYSIECKFSDENPGDFFKFAYDGVVHKEYNSPYWLNGNAGDYVNPVNYLSSCDDEHKTVRVEGHVWSKHCFTKTWTLIGLCAPVTLSPTVSAPPATLTSPTTAPTMSTSILNTFQPTAAVTQDTDSPTATEVVSTERPVASAPTNESTESPAPTVGTTAAVTMTPTTSYTSLNTFQPTIAATQESDSPTTFQPTAAVTQETDSPTATEVVSTERPVEVPTSAPTNESTESPAPTVGTTAAVTMTPTMSFTSRNTFQPTIAATQVTDSPTATGTEAPTVTTAPSVTATKTNAPSVTEAPTASSMSMPTGSPSDTTTMEPTQFLKTDGPDTMAPTPAASISIVVATIEPSVSSTTQSPTGSATTSPTTPASTSSPGPTPGPTPTSTPTGTVWPTWADVLEPLTGTECPVGYKLVSNTCVVKSCEADFQCPGDTVRVANRQCYQSIRDCVCPSGFTQRLGGRRDGKCRETLVCKFLAKLWKGC